MTDIADQLIDQRLAGEPLDEVLDRLVHLGANFNAHVADIDKRGAEDQPADAKPRKNIAREKPTPELAEGKTDPFWAWAKKRDAELQLEQ